MNRRHFIIQGAALVLSSSLWAKPAASDHEEQALTVVLVRANEPTKVRGFKFSAELLERITADLNKGHTLVIPIEYAVSSSVPVSAAVGMVESAWIKDDMLIAKIAVINPKVLPDPKRHLAQLRQLTFALAGIGTILDDGTVAEFDVIVITVSK